MYTSYVPSMTVHFFSSVRSEFTLLVIRPPRLKLIHALNHPAEKSHGLLWEVGGGGGVGWQKNSRKFFADLSFAGAGTAATNDCEMLPMPCYFSTLMSYTIKSFYSWILYNTLTYEFTFVCSDQLLVQYSSCYHEPSWIVKAREYWMIYRGPGFLAVG